MVRTFLRFSSWSRSGGEVNSCLGAFRVTQKFGHEDLLHSEARGMSASGMRRQPKGRPKQDDVLDQAQRGAAPFRRYAMKPTPQKPRIIIAQVEGSGTPDTSVKRV